MWLKSDGCLFLFLRDGGGHLVPSMIRQNQVLASARACSMASTMGRISSQRVDSPLTVTRLDSWNQGPQEALPLVGVSQALFLVGTPDLIPWLSSQWATSCIFARFLTNSSCVALPCPSTITSENSPSRVGRYSVNGCSLRCALSPSSSAWTPRQRRTTAVQHASPPRATPARTSQYRSNQAPMTPNQVRQVRRSSGTPAIPTTTRTIASSPHALNSTFFALIRHGNAATRR